MPDHYLVNHFNVLTGSMDWISFGKLFQTLKSFVKVNSGVNSSNQDQFCILSKFYEEMLGRSNIWQHTFL